MKGNRIYILCILIFLLIMFVIEYNAPKRFVWKPTFSHKDSQPFGCAVFDDLAAASLPGYQVTGRTLYQLAADSLENTGILITTNHLDIIDVERDAILSMAARGNTLMLVSDFFNRMLKDTLGFGQNYNYMDIESLAEYASVQMKRDTMVWQADSIYNERVFTAYPHLLRSYFVKPDSSFTTLARINNEEVYYDYDIKSDTLYTGTLYTPPIAIARKVGKGEIVLVSTPLLFTNYGILDSGSSDYIFRLLTRFKGMPVLRAETYAGVSNEVQTPLRYLLSITPLRWALYMGVILLLLFMVFTARRRQRAIPVIRTPENKSVEFVELIGTLYFQRKEQSDLIRKKIVYFAETLRRTIQVDIEDESDDKALALRMSQKTGMDQEKIGELLADIRSIIHSDSRMTDTQMRDFIDRMNEIIHNI